MIRLIHAEGGPAERGRAIGTALGDLIDASLGSYRLRLAEAGLGRAALARTLAPYRSAAERRLPELVAQLDATADAAGVLADELFAVNAWEELDPLLRPREAAVGRCTTFTATADGATVLAHAEHWLADDAGSVAVVVERPAGGAPAVASPTIACCLPAVGMNAHRVAQGIDSLTAADDRPGIPRVLVSRHALESSGRADAVRRAGLAGRAGGYGHVFVVPGGETFTVETTAERLAVIDGPGPHTNHYLDPELAETGTSPRTGSLGRLERLEELLAETRPQTPEDAMAVLRDDGVAPAAQSGYATLFAVVCEVESGRMWVAPGDPRETAFEELDLTDVV